MCDNETIHSFYAFLGKSCPCGDNHIHKSTEPEAQNPQVGGTTRFGEESSTFRQEIESPELGGAQDMFPARGLGSNSPSTGQGLQEGGPTNPSFSWQEEADREVTGKLAEMEETLDAVQTIYDQDPAFVAKLEEQAGFDYRRVVGQVSMLKEEEARLEEILSETGNLGKYGKKLDKLRSKITRTRAKLEALGMKTPVQTAEIAALSPPPQTPAGQSALAQREAMKRELPQAPDPEAVKSLAQNYVAAFNSLLNLNNEVDGRANPDAKISASPGRSGSSGVYRKSSTLPSQSPDDKPSTYRFTKHVHEHSSEAISCECGWKRRPN